MSISMYVYSILRIHTYVNPILFSVSNRLTWADLEINENPPHVSHVDNKALFTSTQKPKIFEDSPLHRIFRRMHRVLNVDENKN